MKICSNERQSTVIVMIKIKGKHVSGEIEIGGVRSLVGTCHNPQQHSDQRPGLWWHGGRKSNPIRH